MSPVLDPILDPILEALGINKLLDNVRITLDDGAIAIVRGVSLAGLDEDDVIF